MQVQNQPTGIEGQLGPLSQLIGAWEGEKGHDTTSPSDTPDDTRYRETITFEPVGPIPNGSHELYGLRYSTYAWAMGEEQPFHEELGYWFWSAEDKQIIRCFTNHNGVAINAGGHCEDETAHFEMHADSGSDNYGITSNPALNNESKTLSYKLVLDIFDENNFGYSEETHMQIQGQQDEIIHRDENLLTKVY